MKSAKLNPMWRFSDKGTPWNHHHSAAQKLSEECIWDDKNDRETHWVEGARGVFADVILGLGRYGSPKERNLPAAARILKSGFEGFCRRMVETGDSELAPRFRGYLEELQRESRSFADILQTATVQTRWLLDPAIAEVMSESSFNGTALGERVSTVYIVLPMEQLDVARKFFRIMTGGILADLLRTDRRRKYPVLMICDEAYQYGRMDSLVSAYGMARGFGVKLWTIWNDLSQMRERYPQTYLSILANSAVQIFLGSREPSTSKFMSEQSGFRDVTTQSKNVNWDMKGMPHISEGKAQGRREVLMTQEAQNLPADEALIWVRGVPGVIRAVHKKYFEQWGLRWKARKNPLYKRA